MNYPNKVLPIISKLFVGINLSFFIIIFVIKTETAGGISWFTGFSWVSIFNIVIDIALGSEISSTQFICIWFIFTFVLSSIFFFSMRFDNRTTKSETLRSIKKMAIDIDDLNALDKSAKPEQENGKKPINFSDSLSEVRNQNQKKVDIDSKAVNEINDLMATIPPDIAEKFKDLKKTLETIDTQKSDDSTIQPEKT